MEGPNKNDIHPNPKVPSVCFIKNVVKNPNIVIGDYTYYDDSETGGVDFESHVSHHYPFIGDKLIIGKFCAIAKGVRFIMNGANHRFNGISTYPFNIMGKGYFEKVVRGRRETRHDRTRREKIVVSETDGVVWRH